MAWNAPKTFVDGVMLTADDLNMYLRDALKETMPGKASSTGSHFICTGENEISERKHVSHRVNETIEVTSAGAWVDAPTGELGPKVTVNTGSFVIIWINADLYNSNAVATARMSVAVTGASRISADIDHGLSMGAGARHRIHGGTMVYFSTLTPGENTFTCKYRSSSGTATFFDRELIVMPF